MDPAEKARLDHDALIAQCRPQECLRGDTPNFGGRCWTPDRVVETLSEFITEERKEKIAAVVGGRTRHLAVMVEGLVNTGNVSAVMRTAEALGLLDFHVVDYPGATYKVSERTSIGAEQWLDVRTWHGLQPGIDWLREHGYRIVATHLDDAAVPLEQVDFSQPTALVFGNELEGITPEMAEAADVTAYLPMSGFAQSFNISVAAAMALHHAVNTAPRVSLSESERVALTADYYLRSVRRADLILARKAEDQRAQ